MNRISPDMDDSNLYRVLQVAEDTLTANPIEEEEGRFVDAPSEAVQIANGSENASVAQILSFVEPGHVLRGTLTQSNSSYEFATIEHRGGFSLVELDALTVPYLVRNYWEQDPQHDTPSVGETAHVAPLSDLADDVDDSTFCGELVIQSPSCSEADSWKDFRQGVGGEEAYGGFKTTAGRPEEVFIGSPAGDSYWYAILFPEDRSVLARRVRAQVGYLYDNHYVPNPAWDSAALINPEKLPDDLDENLKGIFAPGFNVHSSAIPERFGRDTVELLAELVYVGSQFEATLTSSMGDALNLDDPISYAPADVRDATVSVVMAYRFYTSLLIDLYERVRDIREKTVEGAVEDGLLPAPELLYQARLKFESQIHETRAYLEKMQQVPLEAYVVERFKGAMPDNKKQLRAEYGVEGLPLMIRHILHDIEHQLDTLTDVLKVSDGVATAVQRNNELHYELRANEEAYELIKRHQDHVSDHLTPAELGGEGLEVFMLVLGRLGRRHDWLDTSALGEMGAMLTQVDDMMRERHD
jgi:hypothetical protein